MQWQKNLLCLTLFFPFNQSNFSALKTSQCKFGWNLRLMWQRCCIAWMLMWAWCSNWSQSEVKTAIWPESKYPVGLFPLPTGANCRCVNRGFTVSHKGVQSFLDLIAFLNKIKVVVVRKGYNSVRTTDQEYTAWLLWFSLKTKNTLHHHNRAKSLNLCVNLLLGELISNVPTLITSSVSHLSHTRLQSRVWSENIYCQNQSGRNWLSAGSVVLCEPAWPQYRMS